MRRAPWVRAALVLPLLMACVAPPSPQPRFLGLSTGTAQAFDGGERPLWGGVELRLRPMEFHQIVPTVGVVLSEDRAAYVYATARRDFWLDERWVVTPSFGPGLYSDGDLLELGSIIEFRSGIDLAYRCGDAWRLGLSFYHVSNAGIGSHNPGTEVLVLTLALPIG